MLKKDVLLEQINTETVGEKHTTNPNNQIV